MTRRLRAVATVLVIAALGWACPRAPSAPLSVAEGMKTAEEVRLVRHADAERPTSLVGKATGSLDPARGHVDWKVIDFPSRPGEVYVFIRHRGADDSASFELFDAQGQTVGLAVPAPHPPGHAGPTDLVELTLEHVSGRVYVRVYAAGPDAPASYDLGAYYDEDRVEVDAAAPCDPKHIDIANPNCDDVNPWCDPNAPDFANPSCCAYSDWCEHNMCLADLLDLRETSRGLVGRSTVATGVLIGMIGTLSLSVRDGTETRSMRKGSAIALAVHDDGTEMGVRLPDGVTLDQVVTIGIILHGHPDCLIRDRAGD